MDRQERLGFAIRVGLIATVLMIVARTFAWRQIVEATRSVHLIYLLPVVLIITPASVLLRSLRWRCLLIAGNLVPLSTFVRAYLTGFLANSLLLGKLGDLVKAKIIVRPGLDYTTSVASAFVDRLLEGLALVIVLGAALIFAELPIWAKQAAVVVSLSSVLVLALLGLSYWKRDLIVRRTSQTICVLSPSAASSVARTSARFLEAMQPLTHTSRVVTAMGYSITVWALEIGAVIVFLKAFDMRVPQLSAAILILVALNFGTLVPISPGSIGVYQLLCVFALAIWSVNREIAFSFGLVMQAALFIPVYLAGGVAFLFTSSRVRHGVGVAC